MAVVANEGVGCETISDILLTLPAHTLHSTSFVTQPIKELTNKRCKNICGNGSQIKDAGQLP